MRKITLFMATFVACVLMSVNTWGAETTTFTLPDSYTNLRVTSDSLGWHQGLNGDVKNQLKLPMADAVLRNFGVNQEIVEDGFFWGMCDGNVVCAASDLNNYSTTGFNLVGRQAYKGTYAALVFLVQDQISDVSCSFEAGGSIGNATFSIWVCQGEEAVMVAGEEVALTSGTNEFSAEDLTLDNGDRLVLIWNTNTAGATMNISSFTGSMSFEPAEKTDVVYHYTFEGDTVKTESFRVVVGNARPSARFKIPYACEADYSAVPDYITEAGEYVIPISKSEEYPIEFSTDVATAKWYTIRMRSGWAGCDGTNFPETSELVMPTQPSTANYLYAFTGNPFGIKVLLPNGQYMVNSGNNNERSTFNEKGSEFMMIECNDAVTFTVNGKTGTFNDVQKSIGFWATSASYTDGGSTMYIEEADNDIRVYQIVFAPGAPTTGGALYDFEHEFFVGDRFCAISATEDLTADAVAGYEVEGYEVAVTLEGRVFTVTYTPTKSAAWLELSALIEVAINMTLPEGPWGTDPGYYNEEAVNAFPDSIQAATDVLEAEEGDETYRVATANLRAAIKAVQIIMPEVGKVYMWENAKKNGEGMPIWQAQQGVDKVAYSTGTKLRWHTLDKGDLSNFWYVTAVNGDTVTFRNLMDGNYPQAQTVNNQPHTMAATVNGCKLLPLGDAQFGIRSVGSPNSMHAGQYNDGNAIDGDIQIWTTPKDGYSAWYIKEYTEFEVVLWGEYTTLIVPFEAQIPGGIEACTCDSISGNGTLELEAVETIEANKPYILRGEADQTYTLAFENINIVGQPVTEGLLTGVFVTDTIPVGAYYFYNDEGFDCFVKRTEVYAGEEAPTVAGGHCYIRDFGCQAEVLYFDPALAIENIDAKGQQPTANAIFNLAGQKMNKVQKGINIVDGKKVIF